MCQVGVDSSYTDANNCRGYIVCVAGEAFNYVCPGQLVFNPQLHFCDFDLHNSCPRRGKVFYLLLNYCLPNGNEVEGETHGLTMHM